MVASVAFSPEHALAEPMSGPAPTGNAERIGAIDFVRGCALFGILFMNITAFGLSRAYSNPVNNGGSTGADLWSWIIIQVGLEGTQRGLFSMLYGAGIVLLTTRLEKANPAGAADIFIRRNLWLVGFGLVNAWILLWSGDILYFYGITALFAFGFRKLPPRWLLGIGALVFLLSAAWSLTETMSDLSASRDAQAAQAIVDAGGTASDAQQAAIDGWRAKVEEHAPPAAVIEEDIAAHRAGWVSTLVAIAPEITYMQSWVLYRYFFDIFGMMLIGMALFKLGVLTLERPGALYWAMMLGGYGIGLSVNITEVRWIMTHDFGLLAADQADITYDLGRLAMTVGHLGALLLYFRSGAFNWLRNSVAAVGQMALSNYLSHSLACLILFTGFGLYGQLARHQLYYVVFAICAVQLVISPIWLRHYRFGPVEWVWRSLTYWKRPAFRKRAAA